MIELKPINVGIGGPLSALLTGLTGVSKSLPWWAVCPLYFVLAAPLILLCPVLLPLWLLKTIADSKVDEQSYHELSVKEQWEDLQVNQTVISKLSQEKESEAKQNNQSDDIEGIGNKDVNLAKVRSALLDEQVAQEKLRGKLSFHLVSIALAKLSMADFIKHSYVTLIVSTLVYYCGLVLSFVMSSSLIEEAMARYLSLASERKVLQIATQEQLEYANSVVNIISWAGVFVVLMIISSFAVVIVKAIKFALSESESESQKAQINGSLFSLVVKTILVNLPGMGVLVAMLYACFINLERYYSHLRMIAMEAMVLGQEYFDPTWLFLGLRCYLIYAFALALAIVLLMSWSIVPITHKRANNKLKA